jgi:prepilin-type N-terminal cleavage/methylation domain-containing protein
LFGFDGDGEQRQRRQCPGSVLEPVTMKRSGRGFTLIELMVVVALAAVVLALAAPSFTGTLARKRLEGIAEVFGTDLQYARSEAVARNLEVRLATGAGGACYTIYVFGGGAGGTCSCNPAVTCTTAAPVPIELKTVALTGTGVALTASTTFPFEPLRGMLNPFNDQAVTFSSAAGPWQLTTAVNAVGRASTCSPSGTLKAYKPC